MSNPNSHEEVIDLCESESDADTDTVESKRNKQQNNPIQNQAHNDEETTKSSLWKKRPSRSVPPSATKSSEQNHDEVMMMIDLPRNSDSDSDDDEHEFENVCTPTIKMLHGGANTMNVNTIEPTSTSNQSLMSSSSSSSKMISTRRNRNKSQQQKHQQQRCDDSPSVIDLVDLSFQTTTPKIPAATSYHNRNYNHNRNAVSHSKAKRNETYRDIMQGFIDGFSSSDDEDELLGITMTNAKAKTIAIATKNSEHDYKKSNIENDDVSSISTNMRKKQYDNADFSTSTSAREESSRRNNPNEDDHVGGDTNMICLLSGSDDDVDDDSDSDNHLEVKDVDKRMNKPQSTTIQTMDIRNHSAATLSTSSKTQKNPFINQSYHYNDDDDDDNNNNDEDDSILLDPGPFAKKKRAIPQSCVKNGPPKNKRDMGPYKTTGLNNRNQNISSKSESTKQNSTTTTTTATASSLSSSSFSVTTPRHKSASLSVSFDIGNDFDDLISPIPSTPMVNPSNNNAIGSNNINTITSSNTLTPSTEKKNVPTPSLPPINVTKLGGKLYPDFRHQFIIALDLHARKMRLITHQRKALDSCVQAIITLALYPYPIRTSHAGSSIKGVGTSLVDVLKEAEEKCIGKDSIIPYNPIRGKVSSVTAATLICLLEFEDKKRCTASSTSSALCTMEELLRGINDKFHNRKSNSRAFPKDVHYYLDKNNIDPGWMQIQKLCTENIRADREQLIKQKSRKNECKSGIVFELLDEGRCIAQRLKSSLYQDPLPPGPLRQLASDTVDDVYGNVTLSMDFREGGGGSRRLHDMCDYLDCQNIPYVVRNLKISDYIFFVGDKLAPILIERKTIEDVAMSISDGRWRRQQHAMRKAQYILGGGEERRCQLCYLIEGDTSTRIVHGGFIGRRAWGITLDDVNKAIEELPMLGFSVMKTRTKMGSLHKVSQVARDVLWKARNGSIDCTYKYDDFVAAVNRLDDNKGQQQTDREHQNPAPPITENLTPMGRHSALLASAETDENGRNELELTEEQKEKEIELKSLPISKLKEMCRERDEKMSGTKNDLVARLLQKRKPEILITRARQKQYVPKLPSCNAALLVAILLHDESCKNPMKKEMIMNYAEETGISKDPIFGNGKSWYDGWSGIKDMTGGDPPLISVVKRKYTLTTQPRGSAGLDVARGVHIMAHRMKLCRCGRHIQT